MKTKIITLGLIAMLAFTGCSSNTGTETNDITIAPLETQEVSAEETKSADTTKRTDETEDRENFNKEKITGEISKIVGNILTLELFIIPERTGRSGGGTEEESTTSPLVNTSSASVPGQGPGAGGGGGSKSGGSRTMEFEKSGETVQLIIPVGTEIVSTTDADTKYEIESLAKGMNLTVFVQEELTANEKEKNPDSNTVYADSVKIMQTN